MQSQESSISQKPGEGSSETTEKPAKKKIGKPRKELTKEQIEQNLHLTQNDAAAKLGVSVSTLKRRYYEFFSASTRWPTTAQKNNQSRRHSRRPNSWSSFFPTILSNTNTSASSSSHSSQQQQHLAHAVGNINNNSSSILSSSPPSPYAAMHHAFQTSSSFPPNMLLPDFSKVPLSVSPSVEARHNQHAPFQEFNTSASSTTRTNIMHHGEPSAPPQPQFTTQHFAVQHRHADENVKYAEPDGASGMVSSERSSYYHPLAASSAPHGTFGNVVNVPSSSAYYDALDADYETVRNADPYKGARIPGILSTSQSQQQSSLQLQTSTSSGSSSNFQPQLRLSFPTSHQAMDYDEAAEDAEDFFSYTKHVHRQAQQKAPNSSPSSAQPVSAFASSPSAVMLPPVSGLFDASMHASSPPSSVAKFPFASSSSSNSSSYSPPSPGTPKSMQTGASTASLLDYLPSFLRDMKGTSASSSQSSQQFSSASDTMKELLPTGSIGNGATEYERNDEDEEAKKNAFRPYFK